VPEAADRGVVVCLQYHEAVEANRTDGLFMDN
jgi:hypothetical protein